MKTLVYGFGNISRQDDALGVEAAERIREWIAQEQLVHVTVEASHQLQIEDAATVSEFDRVLFVDASVVPSDGVEVLPVEPGWDATHTTHSLTPEMVVGLCASLYGRTPSASTVHIRGYSWELGEPMTSDAARNLDRAVNILMQELQAHPPDAR